MAVNVNTSSFIANGGTFTVVKGAAGVAVGTLTAANITSNSEVISFTQDAASKGGSSLILDAVRATAASLGSTADNSAVGAALDTIKGNATGNLLLIQDNVQNAASAGALNNVLSAAAPTVDGSSTVTALNVGSQVQGLAETRIASLRSGDALSGVAAGAAANGWNMWLQGYGQHGVQSTDEGIAGYTANTYGGAVGIDTTAFVPNAVIGVSFNYGNTSATSQNSNATSTSVDNYGFNLYGSYDLGQDYFMNGQAGYAYNKITDDRFNVGGIAGVTAHGDSSSDQYMAKVGFGRDFNVEHGLTLTPAVSAAYTHLSTGSYTESGAGTADLNVGSNSLNVLNLGVGVNAAWNLKNTDGSMMKPAVHVGYAYEALNDRVDTTSTFTGDATGTAFVTQGPSPDRSALDAGLGLTYMTTANFDLSANYDYTYKANYDSHTGTIRATSHF